MRLIINPTIGSDPELFIINKRTNTVVSSIGLIPGRKREAYVPEGFPEGFGLQIDNILAEFNIPPVILNDVEENKKIFSNNIIKMKNYIKDYVSTVNPDYDIMCCASAHVPEDQLQSFEAQQFGCSPDYNVYTLSENEPPQGQATNLRSTGEMLAR